MVATYAKVTVTQGLSGTVTIAVEGEAGQIGVGTSNWPNYDYSTVITESYKKLIKNAKHLVITGNVNSTDMAALVGKNANGNNWTLEELDMSRAMLVVPLDQNVEDHSPLLPNSYSHIDCKKVSLPKSNGTGIPNSFGNCFGTRLESVVIPEGYTTIGNSAFEGKSALKKVMLPEGVKSIGSSAFIRTAITNITLPNSLETIGDEAFEQCQNLKVIVFPKGLKSIGYRAFYNTKLMDVYFLGKEAPTVHADAFDDGTYRGNNSFKPTNYGDTEPIGDTSHGYAERRNYVNGANTFGLLHLRADLTDDERAKYTDITRQYKVEKDANGSGFYHAFYDLYYGNMKIWPGSHSYQHTREDADDGKLWDGVTTYEKDKYQGLHRFSLTVSNIYNDDTKKWPFDRIKSADQWWTICVPFSMTKAQVRAVFGDDTEVCKMNAVVRDVNHKRITLKFQDEQMAKAISDDAVVLQANIAYMIFPTKPLASGEKYIMENYQMETGSPEPTFVKPTLLPAGSGDNGYTYRFIGTYLSQWQQGVDNGQGTPIYMPKHSYFLGQSGDKHVFFYQTGETGRWNPFTATVQVFKGQSHDNIDDSFNEASCAKTVSLFGLADDSTGIDELAVEFGKGKNSAKAVYNLNGQAVRQGTDRLQGLGHGIYIVNGKKVYIK